MQAGNSGYIICADVSNLFVLIELKEYRPPALMQSFDRFFTYITRSSVYAFAGN